MRIAVIGAGSWGSAAAGLLAAKGHSVELWARRAELAQEINETRQNKDYLGDYVFPSTVHSSSNISEVLAGSDAVVMVTPAQAVREVAKSMVNYVNDKTPIVVLSKGVEHKTGLVLTDVIAEELGGPGRVAALSGPNHAEEICKEKPTAAVVASYNKDVAEFFQELFARSFFRVYTSTDLLGVELCAASKNIIAIATGMSVGQGLGDNTSSVIMTRGLAEISRLMHAMGAEAKTAMGLAGMGDLITTCISENSRNRSFGVSFAQGESLDDYKKRRHMVVEGAYSVISIRELAKQHKVEMPITEAVYQVLYEGKSLKEESKKLFDRELTQEFYGFE